MTQQTTPMSQEQLTTWVREQFQRANKHLAENGVIFDSVITEESRYLAPFVAVWKIKSLEKKYYWVISGDVPCDFIAYENEKTARDAIRHFSLMWQLKAENLSKGTDLDKAQQDYIDLLVTRAEGLYRIYNQKELWQEVQGGKPE
ncbi:DUF4826 family protein [Aliiglaciecola litoralis]|uniref:DUF4826 family protein n=1 Tax=Aliiglaciecola litoralis TaxID=582857 RepID=A0ABP3WNJ3_9ALTE